MSRPMAGKSASMSRLTRTAGRKRRGNKAVKERRRYRRHPQRLSMSFDRLTPVAGTACRPVAVTGARSTGDGPSGAATPLPGVSFAYGTCLSAIPLLLYLAISSTSRVDPASRSPRRRQPPSLTPHKGGGNTSYSPHELFTNSNEMCERDSRLRRGVRRFDLLRTANLVWKRLE
jgi:hypothetical protein